PESSCRRLRRPGARPLASCGRWSSTWSAVDTGGPRLDPAEADECQTGRLARRTEAGTRKSAGGWPAWLWIAWRLLSLGEGLYGKLALMCSLANWDQACGSMLRKASLYRPNIRCCRFALGRGRLA